MNAKAWGIEFVNALNNNDWDETIRIKNESVPDKIYKYFPLYNDTHSKFSEENKLRLDSLENQNIWASTPKKLNDPFELKALTLDIKRIERAGWDVKLCEKIINQLSSNILVCCFSNGIRKRIPLWAHYANNHQGFCIKYGISDKNQIFPVIYSNQRLISATIVTKLCQAFLDGYEQRKEPGSDFWHYYRILFLTFCTKSSEWKYEHEYRVFDFNEEEEKPGKTIPLSSTGLHVEKIFIGMNCAAKYEKELVRIGKLQNCPVYKMGIVENSVYYSMRPRKMRY